MTACPESTSLYALHPPWSYSVSRSLDSTDHTQKKPWCSLLFQSAVAQETRSNAHRAAPAMDCGWGWLSQKGMWLRMKQLLSQVPRYRICWNWIFSGFFFFFWFFQVGSSGCGRQKSLIISAAAAAAATSHQSGPTLCDPIDGSPPGSPIPGILQARALEWVAIPFSSAWKWKVKVKLLSPLRDPMDCSPSGSSIHGICQARILEWLAIVATNGWSHSAICSWWKFAVPCDWDATGIIYKQKATLQRLQHAWLNFCTWGGVLANIAFDLAACW